MAGIFRSALRPGLFSLLFSLCSVHAQEPVFTRQDSLRGSLGPERNAYRVHHYELNLDIHPEKKYLKGFCKIDFVQNPEAKSDQLQFDLFENYHVDSIIQDQHTIRWKREGNVLRIDRPSGNSIKIYYQGSPIQAELPPWSGGFVWEKDMQGNPWTGVACEGMGASSWWPLKDHLSEEPDSVSLNFTVPEGLVCVSNGILTDTLHLNNHKTLWKWKVHCPINNYNVTFNLGKFSHFNSIYAGENGPLNLDFYVLEPHLKKYRKYFLKETPKMLKAFEHYFGPYPCYTDGYALVETPYYGMEHQGAISYGNHLKKLKPYNFDFILVHESGHEWWGNSISCTDHAEMWIHEGFTTYSEALYVEYYQGKNKSLKYLETEKKNIRNTSPMLGPAGVNFSGWGHSDNYYKGTWFLHTLRHSLNQDALWFAWLKKFCVENRYSFQTTLSIQKSLETFTQMNLKSVFDQYLKDTRIPVLKIYREENGNLRSRWTDCVKDFSMPVYLQDGSSVRIDPDAALPLPENILKPHQIRNIQSHYLIRIEVQQPG